MAEREQSIPHQEQEIQPRWDFEAISTHLDSPRDTRIDKELGIGTSFHIQCGDTEQMHLTVYPQHDYVSFVFGEYEIPLPNQEPPQLGKNGILLHSPHGTLGIMKDGTALLAMGTPEYLASLRAGEPQTSEQPILTESEDRQPAAQPTSQEQPQVETRRGREKQPQVKLTNGRLGSDPFFRDTPNHKIGQFAIYVDEETDEGTTRKRHDVIAFDERAEALERAGLQKGDSADVVGYVHKRTYTDKQTKQLKTVEEVYAAVIIPR